MVSNSVSKVLIVGGGVGGMSLAIGLRERGVAVDLIDIDPQWRAAGAGLTLNGATLRALKILGVLDDVVARGHVHGGRRIHHADGTLIADEPAYTPDVSDLSAMGGILRPVLHAILSARVLALDTNVRLGVTIDTLSQAADGVDIVFTDGSIGKYDLVAGADGLMSQVRRLVMPEALKPKFTGQGCWRAIFRRPPEIKTNWLFVDPSRKVGFNPISDDQMYMFMLESAPGNPWLEESEWPAMLADRMRGYGGIVRELAEEIDENTSAIYRPLETLLVPPQWHRGRVVLLGDAAHATTPHAGYGAGLSIEDGIVLAEELGRWTSVKAALDAYAARRFERCRGVLEGSIRLGKLEMAGAPAGAQVAASSELFALTREPF